MNNIIKNSTCDSVQQSFVFPSEPVIPDYIILKRALRGGSFSLKGHFSHEYPNYNMEDWNFQDIVQESKQSLFITNLSNSFEKAFSRFNKKNPKTQITFEGIKDDIYKDFIGCLWLLNDFGITISSGQVSRVCRKLFLYIDSLYLYDLLTHPELEIFKEQPSIILLAVTRNKDPKAALLGWRNLYESLLLDKDLEIFKERPSMILRAITSNKDPKATLLGWKELYELLVSDKDLEIFKDQPSMILSAIRGYADPKATLIKWKNLYDSIVADKDLEIFKDQPSVILHAIKQHKDPKATLLGWKELYELLVTDKDLEIFKERPSMILHVIKQYKEPKATLIKWKNLYDSIVADKDLEIFKDQLSTILYAIKQHRDPKATLLGWKKSVLGILEKRSIASLPQLRLLSGGWVNLSFIIALISRLMQMGQSDLGRFYLELLEHQHSLYIKPTSVMYKGLRYDSMQEAVVAQIFVVFGFSIVVGKTYQVVVGESKKSVDFRFGDWYIEYHPLIMNLSRGDLHGEAYEEYKKASKEEKGVIKNNVKSGYVQSREDLLPAGADLTVIAEWKLLDCLRHLHIELQQRFTDKCAELCIAEFDQFKEYFFDHMSLVQEAKNTQDMHNIELQNLCDDNLFDDDIDMDGEY